MKRKLAWAVAIVIPGFVGLYWLIGILLDPSIDFYGKIVDERGMPVEDARVDWYMMKTVTYLGFPPGRGVTTSAPDGTFHLSGRGHTFSIEQYFKEGYEMPKLVSLHLGRDAGGDRKANPATFLLIRLGTPRGKTIEAPLNFPWDGTPVNIAVSGSEEEGALIWTATRDMAPEQVRDFTWSVELRVKGGTIQAAASRAPSLAPMDGYGESCGYGYDANSLKWQSGLGARVFFKTAKGHYGHATFYLKANSDEDRRAGKVTITVNTRGGRLVE
ncbi:MAG TPA: hypothetical protein VG796_25550 [Verrucomicrobiales bacterium]|jgi:hypothetical protein|nr:hypothetical protein [Verrucomicrobiales bacterium]